MRPWEFCNCRSLWCWLDALFECRVKAVCDRHDAHITADAPAAHGGPGEGGTG